MLISFSIMNTVKHQYDRLLKQDTTTIMIDNIDTRDFHVTLPSPQSLTFAKKRKGIIVKELQFERKTRQRNHNQQKQKQKIEKRKGKNNKEKKK